MGLRSVSRRAAVQAAHRYPFLSGTTRLAARKSAYSLLTNVDWPAWARTRDDQRLLVPNDQIGHAIYLFGDLDPKISLVMSRALREGDTVLDIGANVGVVSLHCAKLVGPAGSVHAFEPQLRLAEMIRRSASVNNHSNIAVHPVALGERDEQLSLVVPGDCLGAASFVPGWATGGNSLAVQVVGADAYLSALNLAPVRVMKIDVEGYEAQVLRGARNFLATNPPQLVIFEEYSKPATEAESVKILMSLGYAVYGLPKAFLRLRPARLAEQNARLFTDFVAVHPDADDVATTIRALAN